MSIHKLTAGSGYDYLTRQVAAMDATDKGHVGLASYYAERGESPGIWVGAGLAGLGGLGLGDPVTAEQMKALFGHGHHPLAEQRLQALVEAAFDRGGRAPTRAEVRAATRLGAPFRVYAGDATPFRREVARRYAETNTAAGRPANSVLDADVRARIRTQVARELFATEHGRPALDARELAGWIARESRPKTTAVAGYDLTFRPVKSVSTLWALAPPEVAVEIERCHRTAIAQAMRFLESHALYTREGAGGVRQVDVQGLIGAAFTHRDSRAGEPLLHTHVAVANKVQTLDGRWLAIDGRLLFKATVAASETYNSALEGQLRDRLGLRFTERLDAPAPSTGVVTVGGPVRGPVGGAGGLMGGRDGRGKRPVREVVGVDPALNARWSTRRRLIEDRRGVLAGDFQAAHGRPPTPVEALHLSQQATLETREAKHEPRSLTEQRAAWRAQAVEVLGGEAALVGMLSAALHPTPRPGSHVVDAAWLQAAADRTVAAMERSRATWQSWHVRAEALRQVRRLDLSADAVDPLVGRLVEEVLQRRSVPLTPPAAPPGAAAAGVRTSAELSEPAEPAEPAVLRRVDGSSVYTVAGAALYTSHAVLAAEQRLVTAAGRSDGRRVIDRAVDLALLEATANDVALNPGQAHLVRALATSGARVQLALAPAGSGKTTALRALSVAWTQSGGEVVGLAPSAAAAAVLGAHLHTTTDTLAKLTWHLAHPTSQQTAIRPESSSDTTGCQGADDPGATLGSGNGSDGVVPAWADQIGPATLVVIDEAGMADTLTLDTVVAHVLARGGSVRLVGDDQ